LSASARQSRELMEKLRTHCDKLDIAFQLEEYLCFADCAVRVLEAKLPGPLRVLGLPANARTARGYTGDVFLDEFAMHQDDAAIWAALLPTILRGGGELDVASTPRGRRNTFFRMRGNPIFAHSRVTIHDAVAAGLDADPGRMQGLMADPLAWRQEFECEFVDEATAFLTHELISRCVDATLSKAVDEVRLGDRQVRIYFGVDPGRVRDLAVIWLWELLDGQHLTRGVIEMPRTSFARQQEAIEAILARPAVRRGAIDRTGMGMQLAEELATRYGEHRIEPVSFNNPVKTDLAGRLRVLAERGLLRIPADDAIRDDWHAIERIVTPAGHVCYESDRGPGGHSDRFWAAALGLYAARQPGGRIEYVGGPKLAFAGAW
jgi:phage FluMu gp28-like protein